jgi:hypothetical protein
LPPQLANDQPDLVHLDAVRSVLDIRAKSATRAPLRDYGSAPADKTDSGERDLVDDDHSDMIPPASIENCERHSDESLGTTPMHPPTINWKAD